MKKLLTLYAISLILGLFSLSSASAHSNAQTGQMMVGGCLGMDMMDHGGMGSGYMHGSGMQGSKHDNGMMRGSAMGPGRMNSMVEGRLAFLKAELQINDAQEGVWNEYSDAIRKRMAVMLDMHTQMTEKMQDGNAITRMDAHINGMQAMVDALKAVRPATEKLYNALDNEQKKAADHLIGMDCGAM